MSVITGNGYPKQYPKRYGVKYTWKSLEEVPLNSRTEKKQKGKSRIILKESDDMFCNYDQYKDKEVVKKHEQLLKQLGEKDRVFSLEWNEENITLMECCDYCFGHDLTKEECKELSEVFRELAEELGK